VKQLLSRASTPLATALLTSEPIWLISKKISSGRVVSAKAINWSPKAFINNQLIRHYIAIIKDKNRGDQKEY
jgi:hypothetical protein